MITDTRRPAARCAGCSIFDRAQQSRWIEKKMRDIAREEGCEQRAKEALERCRKSDREVWALLAADEAALMRA